MWGIAAVTTGSVSARSQRPRFHRPRRCRIGEINRSFRTKFLDLLQPQINNLDPTSDQPATTRKCVVCGTRGQVQRCECRSTQFGTTNNTLDRSGTRNTSRSNIEHRLSHRGHDPVFLPLMESVSTLKVSIQIKTHHPRGSLRYDLVTIRHPLGPISTPKKRHPSRNHRILRHPHRQREIPNPHPRVTEILPRPRPIGAPTEQRLSAFPGVLGEVSHPVTHRFRTVTVLLHRRTPGHHLPRLHKRIRRDPLHRGQLYPIQQPINRIRARRSRCGESLHHLRVTPQQLVVAVHYLLVIPPRVPVLRQRGGTKRSSLLLQRLKLTLDRFYRTSEIIQRAGGLLKLRFNRLRCRRRRSHQPIRLLRFRSHIHSR